MNRSYLLTSISCAVLAFTCAINIARAAEAPAVEVSAVVPEHGEIYRFISLPGSIRANQQATLCAKIPGFLKSISVDKGDRVAAGQVLAEIEVPELTAEAAKYRAELKVAEADAARIAAARKGSPDLVTPQSVDEAQGKRDIASANLERMETLLNYSRITAPFSGIITMRFVDPGAFIPAPSSGGGQAGALVTLMDFNTVRVQCGVPETEAPFIRAGQPVRITTEGLPGKTYKAAISRQSYALDESTRSALVEADVPNPDLILRPGMYATVKIGVEKHANALLIPVEALLTEKSGSSVFVAINGKAHKTSMKMGFNDGTRAEVVSGISGSEPVILIGKHPLSDGQSVNLTIVHEQ